MNGAGYTYLIISLNVIALNIHFVKGLEFPPKCTNENKTVYLRSESFTLPQPAAAIFANLTLNECAKRCTTEYGGIKCRSFEYNSASQTCTLKKICAQPISTIILANSRRSDTAFFQQICIPTTRLCSAPYTFERISQHTLVDHEIQTFTANSLSACLLNCLEWRKLRRMECRSAMYFYNTRECALSRETRKSLAPEFFSSHPVIQPVDYFENNCFDVDCFEDAHLHWIQVEEFHVDSRYDLIFNAISADECRRLCVKNRMNSDTFPCKAFVYSSVKRTCQLSASSGVKLLENNVHSLPFEPMDFLLNPINAMPTSHLYRGTKIVRPIVPVNYPLLGQFSDERFPQTNIRLASGQRIKSDLAVPNPTELSAFKNGHYFEKICLVGIPKCEEASFELAPNRMLQIREIVLPISSISACLEQCLLSMANCSSVMFFRRKSECIINQRTRFSDPELFHEAEDVNYYDNLCQFMVQNVPRDSGATDSAPPIEAAKSNSDTLKGFRVVFKMTSANITSGNISPPFTTPFEVADDSVMSKPEKTKRPKPIFNAEASVDNMIETECRRSEIRIKAVFNEASSGVLYLRDHFEECATNFTDANEIFLKFAPTHFRQKTKNDQNCSGIALAENVWSYILVLKQQTLGKDEEFNEINRTFNLTCDFTNDSFLPSANLAGGNAVILEQNIKPEVENGPSHKHQDSVNPLKDLSNDAISPYPQIQMLLLHNGRLANDAVNLGEELEIRWVFSSSKSSQLQNYTVNDNDPSVGEAITRAKRNDVKEEELAKKDNYRLRRNGKSRKLDYLTLDKRNNKAHNNEQKLKLERPYGCFVESCIAERLGGVSTTTMTLPLIVKGCPNHFTRERLIRSPITELPDGSGLRTTLKAFRFEGSLGVRIRCLINICVERCEPVFCSNTTPTMNGHESKDFESFGRRKKRETRDRSARLFQNRENSPPVQQSTLTGSYSVLDENSKPMSTQAQITTELAHLNNNFVAPISPIVGYSRRHLNLRKPNFHQGEKEKEIRKSSQQFLSYSGTHGQDVNINDEITDLAREGFIRQERFYESEHSGINQHEIENTKPNSPPPRIQPSSSQHFKENFLDKSNNNEQHSTEDTKKSVCLRRGVFIILLIALSFLGAFQMFYLCRMIRQKLCAIVIDKHYSPNPSFARRHHYARETPIYDSIRDGGICQRSEITTTTSPYFITNVGLTNDDEMYTKYFYKISGDIADIPTICSIDSLHASPESPASNLNSVQTAEDGSKHSYLSFNSSKVADENGLTHSYANTQNLQKIYTDVNCCKLSKLEALDSSSLEFFNDNHANVATSYSVVPLWKPTSKKANVIYANINQKQQ